MNDSKKVLLLAVAGLFVAGCATTQEPAKEEAKPVEEAKPAAAAPAPAPANDSYNVVRGDNLWNISKKPAIYGNPYEWPLIFKANTDKIKDADLIQPGQVFTITRNNSQAAIDAAVKHAKTRGAWSLGKVEASDTVYLKNAP